MLLGAQRFTGSHSITVIEKNDNEWFEKVDDLALAETAVLNTPQRKGGWKLLPDAGTMFSYVEAREIVKPQLKSSSTFNYWWKELIRQRLILEMDTGRYQRVQVPSEGKAKNKK